MKIKITGRNAELFNHNLTAVLNIACVVAGRGAIPTDYDRENQNGGRYWLREKEPNRFQLLPLGNDFWANIRDEGENFIVLEFSYRYDRTQWFSELFPLLLLSMFNDDVSKVE